MMSNTIGKNIKKLRRQNAVKQDVLASSLHLRRQTVSSYERGVTLPNIFILIRIADYFDVTLDELTGRTELAVLDGELRETQTTDYFSKHRRSDCAVRELTAR